MTGASRLSGPLSGWWLWAPCASRPVRGADTFDGPWNDRTKNPIRDFGAPLPPPSGMSPWRPRRMRVACRRNVGIGQAIGGDQPAGVMSPAVASSLSTTAQHLAVVTSEECLRSAATHPSW